MRRNAFIKIGKDHGTNIEDVSGFLIERNYEGNPHKVTLRMKSGAENIFTGKSEVKAIAEYFSMVPDITNKETLRNMMLVINKLNKVAGKEFQKTFMDGCLT